MYKWFHFFLLFISLLLAVPTITHAAALSVSAWHAGGSHLWRTVFPLHTTIVDGASELYYPQSGNYIVASYEQSLSPQKSLSIEGGLLTNATNNIGSDSDWDTSRSNNLWLYGQFKTQAKNYFITIDWKKQTNNHTTLFYGYTYNTNHNSMTDGLYTMDNYTTVHDSLPTLNSYYTMIYQGPHIGMTNTIPITHNIMAISSISYAPYALAQGHGWWNLRDLDFHHTGTAQMLDGNIGLRFAPTPQSSALTIGYRYQYFRLLRGWENLSPDIAWVKATHIQQGYYLTSEMKF